MHCIYTLPRFSDPNPIFQNKSRINYLMRWYLFYLIKRGSSVLIYLVILLGFVN